MRLRAVIVERHTPAAPGGGGAPASTLEALHARIQGRVRGHG